MTWVTIFAEIALLFWFFGCICTYKFGKYILVEGMGIKSAEFFMLCLYGLGIVVIWLFPLWGKWYLLGVLIFWFIVQFFCHWYYTFFGVSEEKLKGYNDCFKNTVHIIPASETKLIPDLYYIILHLLILWNIILVVLLRLLKINVFLVAVVLNVFQLFMFKETRYSFLLFL